MIRTDNQAHLENVLKVLSEDGETPPNWIAHIFLCRCAIITRDFFFVFL